MAQATGARAMPHSRTDSHCGGSCLHGPSPVNCVIVQEEARLLNDPTRDY